MPDMSLDNYFKRNTANMGKPRGKKTDGGDENQHAEQEASGDDANTSSNPAPADANNIIQALTSVIDSKVTGITEKIEMIETSITKVVDKKIADVTKMIDSRLHSVLEAVAARDTEIQALSARMNINEEQIALMDQTTTASAAKITTLEKQVKQLQDRVDQQENHSRRCNIRLLGIEERAEGTNAVKYLEKWIPEFLQLETANGKIVLDRAHRSLAPTPSVGQRPRPLIVKFHYYSDKVRVMDAARLRRLDGALRQQRIHFFHDYSAEVVRKRKAYDSVKTRLRELKVEYALLYPDVLRVRTTEGYRRFSSPGEASVYVRSLEQARTPPSPPPPNE